MKKNNTDYVGTPKIRKYRSEPIDTDFISGLWPIHHSVMDKDDDRMALHALIVMIIIIVAFLAGTMFGEGKAIADNMQGEDVAYSQTFAMVPLVQDVQVTQTSPILESREFTITAYCSCVKCCHKTDGITASGVKVEEGITCAADWSVLTPGSIVDIEGIGVRTVQDKGSSVKGDHIDVYMTDHQTALNFGRQKRLVTIMKEAKQ